MKISASYPYQKVSVPQDTKCEGYAYNIVQPKTLIVCDAFTIDLRTGELTFFDNITPQDAAKAIADWYNANFTTPEYRCESCGKLKVRKESK